MSWWTDARQRRRLGAVAVLVLLAHAGLVAQVKLTPAAWPQGEAAPALPAVRLLYARTVQPAGDAPLAAAAVADAPPVAAVQLQPPQPRGTAASAAPLQPPLPAESAAGAPGPADAAAGTGVPMAEREPPYLPRAELSVPPRTLAPVHVPFPQEITGIVDLRVQLAVFIDEQGAVRRIRMETPAVHPAFERAIREVFLPARFAPGERDGRPVRSQLRLEVQFSAPSARASR